MTLGRVQLSALTWRPVGRKLPALAGLDLRIEPGERVLLVGPSGAGKSTILHAIAGALGTTIPGEKSGMIDVGGRIGLLLQNPADAIVAERMGRDVAFGPENAGLQSDEIWSRVDEALTAVGLNYGREHFTAALSGGEQQRLALAGVLALRPDILLLDEPTAMLDSQTAESVRSAIMRAVGDRTLIVVEHRIGPWLEHVDRVIVLAPGGIVMSDSTTEALLAGPAPAGVWMPDMSLPAPLDVPEHLVAPADSFAVAATDIAVELVTRTLRGTQRSRALTAFSATLEPGTTTAFTGPSGAGKSTALAVMGGLVKSVSGTLTPDLRRLRSRQIAQRVGWVPQNPEHGFLTTQVDEEVARTASRTGRRVDVTAVLEIFGMAGLAKANPYRLSGGEQRRLALAAALAHRPGLVLLDEPTVGQDPGTWAAVTGWINMAANAGAAVGLSTHDLDVPADFNVRLKSGAVL